jgi:hypothetical protein
MVMVTDMNDKYWAQMAGDSVFRLRRTPSLSKSCSIPRMQARARKLCCRMTRRAGLGLCLGSTTELICGPRW